MYNPLSDNSSNLLRNSCITESQIIHETLLAALSWMCLFLLETVCWLPEAWLFQALCLISPQVLDSSSPSRFPLSLTSWFLHVSTSLPSHVVPPPPVAIP